MKNQVCAQRDRQTLTQLELSEDEVHGLVTKLVQWNKEKSIQIRSAIEKLG